MISNPADSSRSSPVPVGGFAPGREPKHASARDISILASVFVASVLFAATVTYAGAIYRAHVAQSLPAASGVSAYFEAMRPEGVSTGLHHAP